jgi:hypothetical protein
MDPPATCISLRFQLLALRCTSHTVLYKSLILLLSNFCTNKFFLSHLSSSFQPYIKSKQKMPHLFNGYWYIIVDNLEVRSTDDLAEAFARNAEERIILVRELTDLLDWTHSPEARQVFRADSTPSSLMLYLKRQIMFKCNRLLDNWNLYIDLCDIDMNSMILSDEMSVENASEQRYLHELDADRLRDMYVDAKREWSREFRSYMITVALHQAVLDRAAGIT